ncbi:MAG: 2-nitropropane dioxygenase [Rickettsiales bacterium]|nr:2-nitropropane dioxygenase [Rickettsiales bacterium]
MPLPPEIAKNLRLPLISAPMFLVSGPDLVIAACRSGVIGSFPTANCRTLDELDGWLGKIVTETSNAAPFAPNLIVHKSNVRLMEDTALVAKHKAPLVIASVGSPAPIIEAIHEYGGQVFADIASMRHAEKAIAIGVDGLILLTAGAGGQTGWANPFAFVRAVRDIFDGPVVLAGGISDGVALKAAVTLGCDLAYMGTQFIATQESMAARGHKDMLVASSLDDIMLTSAFTGLPASKLRPSIIAAGIDPDALPARGMIDISTDIHPDKRPKRWRDTWSAGHSVSGVKNVPKVEVLVDRLVAEYQAAA